MKLPFPSDEREWQAVLSLDNQQFVYLHERCQSMYQAVNGLTYQQMLRSVPKGDKAALQSMEELIFFVLFFLKSGITFDLLGYLFGMGQSRAHRRFAQGLTILHDCLEIEGFVPFREFDDATHFHHQFLPGTTLILDGTEQRIQRPLNDTVQRDYYSGKKKAHTVKSLIISDIDRYIHYVSYCWIGKSNEFAVLKEEFPPAENWFDPFIIRVDLGYQGFAAQYPNVKLFIPNKKPKGGELTEAQKLENQALAKERIVVEHAIGGMKRYDILSNVCRLHDWNIYNTILGTCAGLWNFSQESR